MQSGAPVTWDSIVDFLSSRRGLLDAVVFSGGEPTLQHALLDAVTEVRALGFRVGVHTAGMIPERLGALLPLLDWVGFDVKAPFHAYFRITGVERSGADTLTSLRLLLASGVRYEVRTTVHPSLLTLDSMLELRDQLLLLGVTHYTVQFFRAAGARADRLSLLPEPLLFSLPADYGDDFLCFTLR
jgi:pyruvate formate lyase activating enzyme